MKTHVLFLINIIKVLIPETQFFGLKRLLYRLAGAKIGQNVRICSSAKITGNGELVIGNNTWIGHQALIICSSKIVIGNNIDIAPRVYIGTGTHVVDPRAKNIAGRGINRDIKINDGCWLGACSVILPGVELGSKNVVAAGAVVTRSSKEYILLAGVPAKEKKSLADDL